MKKWLGVFVCVAVAAVATFLAKIQSVIGAPIIALFIGMIINNIVNPPDEFLAGCRLCAKKVLNAAIILAGATLNFKQILGVGGRALPLLVFNLLLVFAVTYFIGGKMLVDRNTRLLVASGTGICGGTAIASVASAIKAKEEQIAYAMTAIFLFDILGAVVYPYLANWIGLSAAQFGVLAGSAINDTSSVAAAESTYSALTGLDASLALTVKLTRTTLLILVVLIFAIYIARVESREQREAGETVKSGIFGTLKKAIPLFIILFLAASILNSFGVFEWLSGLVFGNTAALNGYIKTAYKFLTAVALCGVGFKMKFKEVITKGAKPILLGGIAWFTVFASSMLFILLFAYYVNA